MLTAEDPVFWGYLSLCISLVLTAGIMSGLTLGLLSLDLLDLEMLKRCGSAKEKQHAAKIYPLVQKHHQLLVTLLLCNACAMEALPIYLDELVDPEAAIAISVTAVLLFGEIIPQALCSRYSLVIGARMAWLVRGLMWITSPVSWPISLLLDKLLGHSRIELFPRTRLKELISLHSELDSPNAPLTGEQAVIMHRTIDFREKAVECCMTLLNQSYMLSASRVYDQACADEIVRAGHSRIPLYEGDQITSVLLTKSLVGIDPDDSVLLSSCGTREIIRTHRSTLLVDLLRLMATGRTHMVLVLGDRGEPIGLATLEDIIEELIGKEIEDEFDISDSRGGVASGVCQ